MRFRMHGCGPRGGRGRDFAEAVFAMGGPRGFGGGFGRDFGGGWGDWGQGFGGGGGRGGRHGGRRRGIFQQGELQLVLLKLIADRPRHGYDLIQSIEELTHGAYAPSPGVVYPTLTMLEDMGYIEAQQDEGSTRKSYAATDEGRAHLEEKADEVTGLFERLDETGARERKAGNAPIGRAVGNLLSALWHRVQREGIDDETLHKIAAILDEAAQKVERL